jgi:hypothetical protein
VKRCSQRLKQIQNDAVAKPMTPDSSKMKGGGSKKKAGKREKPLSENITKAKAIGTYTFSSFYCLLKVF